MDSRSSSNYPVSVLVAPTFFITLAVYHTIKALCKGVALKSENIYLNALFSTTFKNNMVKKYNNQYHMQEP